MPAIPITVSGTDKSKVKSSELSPLALPALALSALSLSLPAVGFFVGEDVGANEVDVTEMAHVSVAGLAV